MEASGICKVPAWLIAAAVGAFFVWHGEWASRSLALQPACEAVGYPGSKVTLGLTRYCMSYGDDGHVLTPYDARDNRPGEVDG